MRLYESLPGSVREVIARAPFKFDVKGWATQYARLRKDERDRAPEFRRMVIREIANCLQVEAYRTYGPDHPDAQRNRVTGRPLDNPPKWRGLK